MKTKERKSGKAAKVKDLPAKRLTRGQEAKVKGGAQPVNSIRLPRPVEPLND